MTNQTPADLFVQILGCQPPDAAAQIHGSSVYPQLRGSVRFYQTPFGGILVEAQVSGLPDDNQPGTSDFYGMHIHETGDCSDDFAHTGSHYNPTNALHPQHSGDMPPLLSNQGYAYCVFYDKRFTIDEITDRSVVIHGMRDDFTSQPAGDSGMKAGCGVIRKLR